MSKDKCCICDKPNDFDEGTVSMKGKLICQKCRIELNKFDKLFKVKLKAENNKSLVDRTEYFKCATRKILEESIRSACVAPHSEYYGYRVVSIKEVTLDSFSEMVQLKVEITK